MHAVHGPMLALLGALVGATAAGAQEKEKEPVQERPVPVEGVEVVASPENAIPAELAGFYQRKDRGFGHFLTRDQIQRRRARRLTDLLAGVPGVRIVPTSTRMGTDYVVHMGRSMSSRLRACPALYFVNGVHFEPSTGGMNSEVRPDDIEAIEVYSGASQIPPLFNSSSLGSACGVVAIWTRHGR